MKIDLSTYKGPIEFPREIIVFGHPEPYVRVENQGKGLVQVRVAVLKEPYAVKFRHYPYDIFIHVLKGMLVIIQDKAIREVPPGESYFLAQGFTGIIEVKLEDGLYLEDVLINQDDLLKNPNFITSLLQL